MPPGGCVPVDGEMAMEDQTARQEVEEESGKETEVRIEREEAVEGHTPKLLPDPGQPTAREKEIHNAIYVPFRAWCRECVLGR